MKTLLLLLLLPLMVEAQWTLIPGTTNFELCGVHPTIPEVIFEIVSILFPINSLHSLFS